MINILLVDEKLQTCATIRTILEQGGEIAIDAEISPPAALERVKLGKYDAIIAGNLPHETDCLSFLTEVRTQGSEIPFFHLAVDRRGRIRVEELKGGVEFSIGKSKELSGDFLPFVQILRNAVQRRRAQETLKLDNEIMNSVLMSSPMGMCLFQGRTITWANRKMHSILGYEEEFLSGRDCLTLFTDIREYRRTEVDLREKVDELGWAHTECTLRRKDGTTINAHLQARPIDPEKPLKGQIVLGEDITEHKQVKDLLKKSELRYHDLVESANSIILKMDMQGNILFINRFAEKFFGYRAGEIVGKNVVGTIVPRKGRSGRDLASMIEDMGHNPEAYEINVNENMLHNGERVWVAWTNKGVRDKDGRVTEILCIGHDITDRKLDIRDSTSSIEPWKSRAIGGTDIEEEVFEAAYDIAQEIAREGREGNAVGTAFLLGDAGNVLAKSSQLILNPFAGHRPELRLITDNGLKETIKELAQLDGAFVISGRGIVEAAGRYITIDTSAANVPQGLGTRHASIAAITQATNAVGIVVSQSGGRISVFKQGRIVKVVTR